MFSRILAVALFAIALAPSSAREAIEYGAIPWKKAVIPVYGDAHVRGMVSAFNASMPHGGPQLSWREGSLNPCLPNPKKGRIVFCQLPSDSTYSGATSYRIHDGKITGAQVGIHPAGVHDENLLCHEMMHALTRVIDNYDARPDTSCVWGSLNEPGSWDIAMLESIYGHRGIAPS
jgi:hypothetical protein